MEDLNYMFYSNLAPTNEFNKSSKQESTSNVTRSNMFKKQTSLKVSDTQGQSYDIIGS